ncbi:hypothetical protein [Microvirga sp. CF3016]|nr:hypothetical protein [Microvirga sp. CF3016]MEE1613673.1 hypothetical protein [Microvirga sp. CF3016]
MTKSVHRSRQKAWSPIAIVLAMTAGMMALVGLFHFIIRIATA